MPTGRTRNASTVSVSSRGLMIRSRRTASSTRPRKPAAQRLVQRVERARPRNSPAAAMSGAESRGRRAARRMNSAEETWNSTAKMFVMAIRLCTR